MNDDITTETWFDQRPSHPIKPAEYQAAIDAADTAWQEYNDYVSLVFDGRLATETSPAEWAELNRLLSLATAAEDAKESAYREWMTAGFDPTRSEPAEHIRFMVTA